MLTKALNALILMIAAVLVFISIQDPYTIELRTSSADEKTLIAKELNAQITGDENALISADEYLKSDKEDEAKLLRIAKDNLKIYAEHASKKDEEIYFSGDVRILKDDILLLTQQAKMNIKSYEITSLSKVYAFRNDYKLQADSLHFMGDDLELEGVRLWQD